MDIAWVFKTAVRTCDVKQTIRNRKQFVLFEVNMCTSTHTPPHLPPKPADLGKWTLARLSTLCKARFPQSAVLWSVRSLSCRSSGLASRPLPDLPLSPCVTGRQAYCTGQLWTVYFLATHSEKRGNYKTKNKKEKCEHDNTTALNI